MMRASLLAIAVCALASACSVKTERTVVQQPAPGTTTAVITPAPGSTIVYTDPAPSTTTTVVYR